MSPRKQAKPKSQQQNKAHKPSRKGLFARRKKPTTRNASVKQRSGGSHITINFKPKRRRNKRR